MTARVEFIKFMMDALGGFSLMCAVLGLIGMGLNFFIAAMLSGFAGVLLGLTFSSEIDLFIEELSSD